MKHSEDINELAAALARAQAEMGVAKREASNPFFKTSYADLASVREACNKPLTDHGLSVAQWPRLVAAGDGAWIVEVETTLLHASGQWMRDTLAVPVAKADAQGVGSAISYARRYALSAVVGVAPGEDDGEAAMGRESKAKLKPAPKLAVAGDALTISEAQQKRFFAIAAAAGWTKDELRVWLKGQGFEHTKDIPRDRYDEICAAVEDTAARQREPGDEDAN